MQSFTFRLYWQQLNGTVFVRMFDNGAKCGDLMFDELEWEAFKDCLRNSRNAKVLIILDEPRQIDNAKS